MSRILQNLLREQNQNLNSTTFDFTKSLASNAGLKKQIHENRDLNAPINPQESTWKEVILDNNARCLFRKYVTLSSKHLLYMLNEVIAKTDEMNHHAKIIIDHNSVEFYLTTNTLNDVTELDLELAKFIDEIYDDIKHIGNF